MNFPDGQTCRQCEAPMVRTVFTSFWYKKLVRAHNACVWPHKSTQRFLLGVRFEENEQQLIRGREKQNKLQTLIKIPESWLLIQLWNACLLPGTSQWYNSWPVKETFWAYYGTRHQWGSLQAQCAAGLWLDLQSSWIALLATRLSVLTCRVALKNKINTRISVDITYSFLLPSI